MNGKYAPSERGQAVVLVVLAMVVLLGFTALAVDGSMVYSDRRFAQSAADASSLAGGSAAAQSLEKYGVTYGKWTANPPSCTGTVGKAAEEGEKAAVRRAKENDFPIFDQDITDNMGIKAECGEEPLYAATKDGGKVKLYDDKFMDLRSMVTKETQTAFAHFVFSGPLQNTVTAVTRVRPRQPLAFGYAIVSLNPAGCSGNSNGVQYHGLSGNKGQLTVNGGGVWSNGCMDVDGNVDVEVNNGPVIYYETGNKDDLDKIVMDPPGDPTQLVNATDRIPEEAYDISAPNCSNGLNISADDFVNYYKVHGEPLPAGLICVSGDIKINATDQVFGYGVTLYVTGDISINGGSTVRLTAPPANYSGPAIPGVVLYAPKSNDGEFKINGGGDSYFQGTILAPGANVDLTGNAMNEAFKSQVIAWNVAVGGASGTTVTYDDDDQTSRPTYIELYR